MKTDSEAKSHQERDPVQYTSAKHSRKKKVIVFIIAAGISVFGTLAYLNQSADPTSWNSMQTDYENTK